MSEITALAKALVKAQANIKMPKLDGEGNFHNKFASLEATRDAIIPAMNEQGLAVVQGFVTMDDGIGVSTKLIHESGEVMDCGVFYIPVSQKDAQKYCAASTYARRFALQAMACCVGSADDDGASAVEMPATPTVSKVDKEFAATCTEALKVLEKATCLDILEKCNFKATKEVKLDKDKKNITEQLKAAIALAGLGK
jgi:hypothetical protein